MNIQAGYILMPTHTAYSRQNHIKAPIYECIEPDAQPQVRHI